MQQLWRGSSVCRLLLSCLRKQLLQLCCYMPPCVVYLSTISTCSHIEPPHPCQRFRRFPKRFRTAPSPWIPRLVDTRGSWRTVRRWGLAVCEGCVSVDGIRLVVQCCRVRKFAMSLCVYGLQVRCNAGGYRKNNPDRAAFFKLLDRELIATKQNHVHDWSCICFWLVCVMRHVLLAKWKKYTALYYSRYIYLYINIYMVFFQRS